ncbi:MAG: GTPase [Bdellovibrionales bacterium]
MVSEIAGTTIDSLKFRFNMMNKTISLLILQGFVVQSKRKQDVEVLSSFKSYDAIAKANIVLLVIDGTEGPTVQDAKMMQFILEQHKAVLIVANKSDRGKAEIEAYRSTFRKG